jgi:4-aminobutyrate aminotransferase-like enzyme
MNATGLDIWRTDPFPSNDVLRAPFGDIETMRTIMEANGGEVAAVVAEPIQGNGGIQVPPANYWRQVRSLCDEQSILLILDEIQTGMNRTGRWFNCQHWGIEPDILAIGKALGNGFPISAFVTTDEIAQCYSRPGASTFGGNPVSCAAALATLAFHQSNDLGRRSQTLGSQLENRLTEFAEHSPHLGSPRGCGLMLGVPVLDEDGQADGSLCDEYLERLKDAGVLAGKTGGDRNVLTFMPPLVLEVEHLEELYDAIEATIID